MSDNTQQNSVGSQKGLKDRVLHRMDHGTSKFNFSQVGESIQRGVENLVRGMNQFKSTPRVIDVRPTEVVHLENHGYDAIDIEDTDVSCRIYINSESESDLFNEDVYSTIEIKPAPETKVIPKIEVAPEVKEAFMDSPAPSAPMAEVKETFTEKVLPDAAVSVEEVVPEMAKAEAVESTSAHFVENYGTPESTEPSVNDDLISNIDVNNLFSKVARGKPKQEFHANNGVNKDGNIETVEPMVDSGAHEETQGLPTGITESLNENIQVPPSVHYPGESAGPAPQNVVKADGGYVENYVNVATNTTPLDTIGAGASPAIDTDVPTMVQQTTEVPVAPIEPSGTPNAIEADVTAGAEPAKDDVTIPVINVTFKTPSPPTEKDLEPIKEAPKSDVVTNHGIGTSIKGEMANTSTGVVPKTNIYDGLRQLSDPAPRPKGSFYDSNSNWVKPPIRTIDKSTCRLNRNVPTGLMVREPLKVEDEVRDIMVMTVPLLSKDEVEDAVELDVFMEDDGLTAEFVRLHVDDLIMADVMEGSSPQDLDVSLDEEPMQQEISLVVIDDLPEETIEVASPIEVEVPVLDEQSEDVVVVSAMEELPDVIELSVIDDPETLDGIPTVLFSFGPLARARNVNLTF